MLKMLTTKNVFLNYIIVFISFIFAKIFHYWAIVINIPCEVEYPYILQGYEKGVFFIRYCEALKRLTSINLYWKNTVLKPDSPPISWEFVPDNIDLLIDFDELRDAHVKLRKLWRVKKKQIRLYIKNHKMVFSN